MWGWVADKAWGEAECFIMQWYPHIECHRSCKALLAHFEWLRMPCAGGLLFCFQIRTCLCTIYVCVIKPFWLYTSFHWLISLESLNCASDLLVQCSVTQYHCSVCCLYRTRKLILKKEVYTLVWSIRTQSGVHSSEGSLLQLSSEGFEGLWQVHFT